MVRNALYFFKEALRGFYQAKLMTFVSVVTIGFALFFMGAFAVAYLNIKIWLKEASNRVEVVAFIKDAAASDSSVTADIVSRVKACSAVARATFIDKKEAWKRFQDAYGARMLDAVDDNPLPASIEISLAQHAQSIDATSELQKELEEIPGIEEVQVSQQWLRLLQRFKTYFFMVSIGLGLVLIFALHFMIANTIKLTIYARKELVHNMHFVGATDLYIKMPFILEGVVQGIVGASLAVVALYSVRFSLFPNFHIFWGPWYSVLVIFPVGALFGCIGSMSAVRKFLV
jgi:cell division transport system permease protein